MSTVAVSYKSLKDAASEATTVARKLNTYADSLENTVLKKLNNYKGEWTTSICIARDKINIKIDGLRQVASQFKTYSTDLNGLETECKNVDRAVKTKVYSLTASFKNANGIRNSKIENALGYFFTKANDSTYIGRWLGDKADLGRAGRDYIKSKIKEWYNFEGGKDFVKGVLLGALEIGIAICAVIVAVTTFLALTVISPWAVIVLVAACVGGLIAASNGIANVVNECRALSNADEDPALAKRLSKENTMQDMLRDGDITDENANGYFGMGVRTSRAIASGIDAVNTICAVISITDSFNSLMKSGYKWATGDTRELCDPTLGKDVFSKGGLKAIGGKVWEGIKTNFGELKTGNFKFFAKAFSDGRADFLANLKNRFTNFSDFGKGAKTLKNIMGVGQVIIKDGASWDTAGGLVEKIVLPSISIGNTTTIAFPKEGGQGSLNFDSIKLNDLYSLYDDSRSKVLGSDFFKSHTTINVDVLDKLTTRAPINISIPEIYVPEIQIPGIQITNMAA